MSMSSKRHTDRSLASAVRISQCIAWTRGPAWLVAALLLTWFAPRFNTGHEPTNDAVAEPVTAPSAEVISAAKPPEETRKAFTEIARKAGIRHRHYQPVLDHKLDNIMPWVSTVGAAAAAGDFNNDGWFDLYVTNSRKGKPNYLYRNNGDGTFTDVATLAGVANLNGDRGTSMDCVWGDYDNDGWADLYVVRWGPDVLFRNNGDGTFTDVTTQSFRKRNGSPGTEWANGNAVVFLDYDLDGRLDLYVGNYFDEIDLWHLKTTRIMHDDFEKSRNGGRNYLYHQEPDGTFIEVAASLGVDDPGWTLAVGAADVDNDGWPDLYCADDFGPDQLFINQRNGSFANASLKALGLDTKKGMNVDFGDFNNDGWLDIYVTNITTAEYLQEGNMLWHNNGTEIGGTLSFTDISLETGTYDGGWGWGAKFLDYDSDGDLDILAVNGFISAGEGNYWYDLASWTVTGQSSADARNWPAIGDRSFSGYETTRFWVNDGWYSFVQRAQEVGLADNSDGRGVVCFDYDNDGDVDVYIANQNQAPQLYRNDANTNNHWLEISLRADPKTGTNRDAVGARVTVVTASGRQIRERDGGNGYSGQSDPRLHFGLGREDHVDLLEVRWPDGGLQYLEDVPADRIIHIQQDPKRYASRLTTAVGPPKPRSPARDSSDTKKRAVLSPAQLNRLLTDMETRLRAHPDSFAHASLYRKHCADSGNHDQAISFFKELVKKDPEDVRSRIELGCAYVDKIPTCGGVAAIVSKGTLARKSLDQLDAVIAANNDLWVAYYCRGMNHLHWPRALRHSKKAAADFARCLDIQKRSGLPDDSAYFFRAYVGLGDSHAKNGAFDQARQAYHSGAKLFPSSPQLRKRLAIHDDKRLLKFVMNQRRLENPIDTSLAFLDSKPKATGETH